MLLTPCFALVLMEAALDHALAGQEDIARQVAESMRIQLGEHLTSTMRAVQAAHEQRMQQQERELMSQIGQLSSTVDHLQASLQSEGCQREKVQQQLERFSAKASSTICKTKLSWLLHRVFSSWRQLAKRGQRCLRLDRAVLRSRSRFLLAKYFALLCFQHKQARYEQSIGEVNFKYSTLGETMAGRYEQDISHLQQQLQEAQQTIAREQAKRLQLEEEVKRLLLKNMTAMNIEALAIFKQVNSDGAGSSSTAKDPNTSALQSPSPSTMSTSSPALTPSSAQMDRLSEMFRNSLQQASDGDHVLADDGRANGPKPRAGAGTGTGASTRRS